MFKNPPKGAKFTEHKSQKQNRINFCKQCGVLKNIDGSEGLRL